jgi:hypothetical protein
LYPTYLWLVEIAIPKQVIALCNLLGSPIKKGKTTQQSESPSLAANEKERKKKKNNKKRVTKPKKSSRKEGLIPYLRPVFLVTAYEVQCRLKATLAKVLSDAMGCIQTELMSRIIITYVLGGTQPKSPCSIFPPFSHWLEKTDQTLDDHDDDDDDDDDNNSVDGNNNTRAPLSKHDEHAVVVAANGLLVKVIGGARAGHYDDDSSDNNYSCSSSSCSSSRSCPGLGPRSRRHSNSCTSCHGSSSDST